MSISSHVLDTSQGEPARGVPITLERLDGGTWLVVAHGTTDDDGRLRDEGTFGPGRYRLVFDTATYLGPDAFFPEAIVVFQITDPGRHLHIPLLLSPFGLTTYRGS
ncbi:5-hydroxyisourate hydrolase [Virgisporangium aliadipatigenens]|uniref:5-hydroxyisourate hydrolase n=1 Tax=Virgisporangium aliadipatigenens TaxID=741659 RepID=A0A8J4DQU8_9ACTN|nr:hydroxyisourate hydrolase [Virgisporangium aliadipatigenens]GIJ46391.1 5-hydroxyisourate hydrolase [Virgisporangium aliadipatigenens]